MARAAVLALLGLALWAAPAGAALTAESMYEPGSVVVIELTLPPASIAALEADPEGEYVEGSFELAETTGAPGSAGTFSAPLTVGVRLKGGASFEGLDGKAAFKLKFNSFVKGQKYLGLKKMTLNNMLQDPSMVHEALSYGAFRAAGVAAPHTGYAYLYVNGEDFGMHLNLETMDAVALEKRFGPFQAPPQHLYEGEFKDDVSPGGAGAFEVDEGEEGDRADLEALIAALAAPSPADLLARLAPVADLEEMTRMWAVEKYVGHWDGYSGRRSPNNYYLYSDPAGIFQMLPWGTDQALSFPGLSFGSPGGNLFEACLAGAGCLALYRSALEDARATTTALGLGSEASALAALLEPWQALEAAPRKPFDAAQIEAGVERVREFISARPAALEKWLHPDPPPAPPPAAPAEPAPARIPLSTRLVVDRSRLGSGVLTTSPLAPGPGELRQRAVIATRTGPGLACASTVRAAAAGAVQLSCRLSAAVRAHLARRWLKVRVQTSFDPDSSNPERLWRTIRLPRER